MLAVETFVNISAGHFSWIGGRDAGQSMVDGAFYLTVDRGYCRQELGDWQWCSVHVNP